ncbi:(d)CMP kinase [Terrihabitans sp. B22-R8]|uniref:(d)CMP kinase n=1 Tax=Terrihabitans sp. B22-R8 TaxID=3425128 RepID=UPI00403C632D
MIIAIDGPAASGKGTLGKRLAAHYGFAHLDTGLLYRGVARAVRAAGLDLADAIRAEEMARSLDVSTLDGDDLRGPEMGEAASVVAAHPGVRQALVALQRDFAAQAPGAVLDGRDIGTVICPHAEVKVFVTADPEERARRRHCELAARGDAITYETVLADIRARDARDSGRSVAPLRPADDARLLDTTRMDIEAAFRAAVAIVDGAGSRHRA